MAVAAAAAAYGLINTVKQTFIITHTAERDQYCRAVLYGMRIHILMDVCVRMCACNALRLLLPYTYAYYIYGYIGN